MDFEMISENVSTFLNKQKQTILNNPLSIKMVIRKLELYIDTFHYELDEMLRLEGRCVDASLLASFDPQPQLGEFNLDQLCGRDEVKSKVLQFSLLLRQEMQVYGPKLRGKFATSYTLSEFRNDVLGLLNDTKFNFQIQDTKLNNTIREIRRELQPGVWDWNGSLERFKKMFQQIESSRTVEDYLSKYDGQIQQNSDYIIKKFEIYFNNCIDKYKLFYQGSVKAFVQESSTLSLVVDKESETLSASEEYIREIEREHILQRTTRQEKIVEDKLTENSITAVTITYSNNKQASIRLNQLSIEDCEELNSFLLRLINHNKHSNMKEQVAIETE